MKDRFRDRFQIQAQINWQLMPASGDTWLQWAFSPHFGVTRIGQKFAPFTNGRQFLPEGPSLHTMVDNCDDGKGKDPATGLKNWWFESRVFWVRGAIRVLGLDIGAGLYLRKAFYPQGDRSPQGGNGEAGAVHESAGREAMRQTLPSKDTKDTPPHD